MDTKARLLKWFGGNYTWDTLKDRGYTVQLIKWEVVE